MNLVLRGVSKLGESEFASSGTYFLVMLIASGAT